MSLLAEIEAAAVRRGPPCSVALVLEALEPADRDDLLTALGDRRYASTTIATVLSGRELDVGPDALRRHRAGQCRCSRT